jgi:hypothetical protein
VWKRNVRTIKHWKEERSRKGVGKVERTVKHSEEEIPRKSRKEM